MTVFQVSLLVVFGIALLGTLLAPRLGWLTVRATIAWSSLWGLAIVAVAMPDLTTLVANKVGIHRGKDLVLYIAAVSMLIGFFAVYLRLRKLRRELTMVVRHLALREPNRSLRRDEGNDRIEP